MNPGHSRIPLSAWARLCLFLALLFLLTGCTGIPKGVEPVQGLEAERYLGTWYSIARLDHSFERRLTDVTAHYELREDGAISVLNRGYHPDREVWREARGVARFIESPTVGRLKVSFFGPFHGAYNIVALDKDDYQYAMVTGPTRSYLWILARSPELDPDVVRRLVELARELDYDVDGLIYVTHEQGDRS
ncbi:lipocalin family protein [Ectothiorhodospira lacustris]|uniref:lipocalin family protein n=1 Tax=Ectothiorhodospira lacustris TaxID=2899127 RepID=UPI001EE93A48|nr:lipocalin family protein [Ectothiorhodospira lacustris]MCG5500582.1 lipocalin family protein [Ectothiorhodospira lacustris]MCG5508775.1 lipocalin family protein [Ectothiorhodospira lacustris]MCG5520566.1 lipocalin family protein [Ectothiorhodospira lacustris]